MPKDNAPEAAVVNGLQVNRAPPPGDEPRLVELFDLTPRRVVCFPPELSFWVYLHRMPSVSQALTYRLYFTASGQLGFLVTDSILRGGTGNGTILPDFGKRR